LRAILEGTEPGAGRCILDTILDESLITTRSILVGPGRSW